MATNGTITGTKYASQHLWLTFEWNRSTYSVDKNTSTISWKLILHCNNTLRFSADKSYSLTVNGTTYTGTFTNNISWGSTGGTATIKSGTTIITHNSDGSKSFNVNASFNIQVTYSGASVSTIKLSGTGVLDIIPRASSFVLSTAQAYPDTFITIQIKSASSSFVHTLTYSCGKQTGTIASKVGKSVTWKIPASLITQSPNANQTCTIQCQTYKGTTLIGSKSSTITIQHYIASKISYTNGNNLGSNFKINIDRKSSLFTHKLLYSFGNKKDQLVGSQITTSYSFTPPLSLCEEIPNSTKGNMILTLKTYYGDTQIGQDQQKNCTMNVPSSVIPTLSNITTQIINPSHLSHWNIYLKDVSNCQLNLTIQSAYKSPISKIYINNIEYKDINHTANTNNYSCVDKSLKIAGNKNYTVYVVDSRGRKSQTKSTSIQIINYYLPTLKMNYIYRCLEDGTADDEGKYVKMNASYKIASCENKNTATCLIQCKESTSSYYSSKGSFNNNVDIILKSFEINKAYDFLITVQDTVGKKATYIGDGIIPTALATIDVLKGGNGIAFGKMASDENIIDCGWSLRVPTIEDEKGNQLDISKILIYVGEE